MELWVHVAVPSHHVFINRVVCLENISHQPPAYLLLTPSLFRKLWGHRRNCLLETEHCWLWRGTLTICRTVWRWDCLWRPAIIELKISSWCHSLTSPMPRMDSVKPLISSISVAMLRFWEWKYVNILNSQHYSWLILNNTDLAELRRSAFSSWRYFNIVQAGQYYCGGCQGKCRIYRLAATLLCIKTYFYHGILNTLP